MIENGHKPPEASMLTLADLRAFTLPQHNTSQELQLLSRAGQELYPKHAKGLVIGRFQPLHYGHIYNWKMALAVSESIVIGIGSAETGGEDNPFTAFAREQMVKTALQDHGIANRVTDIIHLKDYEDDERWLKETLKLTGDVGVVVGNNEWVNGIFENAGLAALRPPLLERGIYEGKKFRAQLRLNGKLPSVPVLV